MIIQIKSSYSGPLSRNLEDGQELFISHTHVTHAYIQKQADENAVARLYLSQGELHLAPMSRTENVFLQNRPLTEDTVLGNEYLLQIKESILLFEVAGEIVVIMMGLSLGYGGLSSLKSVKVAELTPLPSQMEKTEASKGKLLCPSTYQLGKKANEERQEETRKTEFEKLAEKYKGNDDDILLSESSTTAGGIVKSVPRMEPSTGGKWKPVAMMTCLMVVICLTIWIMSRKGPVASQTNVPSDAQEANATVESEIHGQTMPIAQHLEEEGEVADSSSLATLTTGKSEETIYSSNKQLTVIDRPTGKTATVRLEDMKPAVSLEERLALARKELADLSKTVDAPPELLEDKRFGQDVEWMTASFDKLKVSLRKVQVRELEKQMAVYQRAKNLDVSKFSEEATADFQRRFKEYTVKRYWGGGYQKDKDFSLWVVGELKKGQVNPNVEVVDSSYKAYSGPLLSCIFSGRIELAAEIAHELLKLGANSDVRFSEIDRLITSDAWTMVLKEGGINKMEGFLLPLLNKPDFYNVMLARGYNDLRSEDLAARLIVLKHNLKERDNRGNTPLHIAAKLGSVRLVTLMLLDGVDVNAANKADDTPLHLALKHGHFQLEPLLLFGGANTALENMKGESVEDCRKIGLFFKNIEKKNYPAIRKALEDDMSPNMYCSNGATILQTACKDNDVELVKLLLEFKVDMELTGMKYPANYKPVAWAFENKSLDVFELLLENGADPNVIGKSAPPMQYLLLLLCGREYKYKNDRENALRCLQALLKAKISPQLVNNQGVAIREALAYKKADEFVSLLLDKYESLPEGCDVVATALFYEYPDSIVETLVEKKADVNAIFTISDNPRLGKDQTTVKQFSAGQKVTALYLAVAQERPKIVELLLKNGADVNWKDGNGKTVKDLPCSDEIRRMLQNPDTIGKDAEERNKQTKSESSNMTIALPGGVELKLVKVEPGSFTNTDLNKKIKLTREYWIGETEVTQGQYAAIMNGIQSFGSKNDLNKPSQYAGNARRPVENVSWNDAMTFCRKLSSLHEGKLPRGYRFDLPTEAQWEFAARGGNKSKGYVYSGGNDIETVAWYNENSGGRTHPVGTKQANELGLYDMSGNVWEWCRDWYDQAWSHDPETLSGMKSGSYHVSRGGSWDHYSGRCRLSCRFNDRTSDRGDRLGFRVALVPVNSQSSASSEDAGKTQTENINAEDKVIDDSSDKATESKSNVEEASMKIEYKTITLPGNAKLRMVKIVPGSFTNTEISKTITLTREYWIGETEVTQGQYAAIMDGVRNEKGETCRKRPSSFSGNERLPVECVSWYDAIAFCRELTKRERKAGRLPKGYEYSLPTEAQWEYAARGGRWTKGYMYSGSNDLDAVGWYFANSGRIRLLESDFDTSRGKIWKIERENRCSTHPVGTKTPNELGLYDMSGNVWEWCRDWYNRDWGHDPETLSGMKEGSSRVFRGGSWSLAEMACRSSTRTSNDPSVRLVICGFRVALVPLDSTTASATFDDVHKAEGVTKTSKDKTHAEASQKDIEYKNVTLPGGVELKLVKVEPGSFRNSGLVKTFTLSHKYWLGETEVTQQQYAAIMEGVTNEKGESCKTHPSLFTNNQRPVEFVSWYDAKAFCKKLNSLFNSRLPLGYQFDLPTEAQWEFAARGGNKSRGYEYSGGNDIETVAWYSGNSGGITHAVGMKQANELGLHDMSGNVWEWCRDWYDNDWSHEPETLARMKSGSYRVRRGGAWINPVGSCRSSYRSYSDPAIRFDRVGFRVALVPVQ